MKYCKPIYSDNLSHHGILGQKWGRKNGPPYPLGASDHSNSERKAGWRKSLSKKRSKWGKSTSFKLTDKQKKYIKIGLAVAGTAAVVGASAYLIKSGRGAALINSGKTMAKSAFAESFDFETFKPDGLDTPGFKSNDLLGGLENLSKEEKGSLQVYTTSLYHQINDMLRGATDEQLAERYGSGEGAPFDRIALSKQVEPIITQALNKVGLTEDKTLYRGTPRSVLSSYFPNIDLSDPNIAEKIIGKKFVEPAFVSSSDRYQKSFGNMKWIISAPKGLKAVNISELSEASYEAETLIQKGTEFFIKDAKINSDGILEIFLDITDQIK